MLEKADDFCLRFKNTSLGSTELQLAANYLRLLHRRCVFVAHRADFHASFSLFVSLLEELLHDPVRPLPVQLQRLGGIAQVRTMYHVSENLQLRYQKTHKIRWKKRMVLSCIDLLNSEHLTARFFNYATAYKNMEMGTSPHVTLAATTRFRWKMSCMFFS